MRKLGEEWVKVGHAHVSLCKRGNIWTEEEEDDF